MPITLDWTDVAIRLFWTLVAGTLVGFNRGDHGRAAGLRTTILVCLAASASMIQANLLLATGGRAPDSFIMLDLMRLPLGILSGMGFIGGGAILRRGNMILGVTTAATLWFVTVMGLCFGGGQIALGLTMLVAAIVILWVFKWIENRIRQDHRAILRLVTEAAGPSESEIREQLVSCGLRIQACAVAVVNRPVAVRKLKYELTWRAVPKDTRPPLSIQQFATQAGIVRVQWQP